MPAYQRKDHYYRRAKDEGHAARSIYKLIEIDRRYHLVGQGMRVVDVGCAPGSWLVWLAERVGPAGSVVGIDCLPLEIKLPKNTHYLQGDINQQASQGALIQLLGMNPDLIVSDAAPNISGIAVHDAAHWVALMTSVMQLAQTTLKVGGRVLMKVFDYPEVGDLRKNWLAQGVTVKSIHASASRKGSREAYWLISLKGPP